MKRRKTVQVATRIEKETFEKIQAIAKKEDATFSEVVRDLLVNGLTPGKVESVGVTKISLKYLRKSKKLTLSELGKIIGVSASYCSLFEHKNKVYPKFIPAYEEIFGIKLNPDGSFDVKYSVEKKQDERQTFLNEVLNIIMQSEITPEQKVKLYGEITAL